MRKMICRAVLFSIFAAMPLTSFAAVSDLFVTDGVTKNEVKFINREIIMRNTGGVWAPVAAPNDLGLGSGNTGVAQGDVLVTLFSATTLSTGSGLTNSGWSPGDSNGFLLGYAAQSITGVSFGSISPTLTFVALDLNNPSADPFGVLTGLTPGTQVAIFNSTQPWVINGAGLTLQQSVTQSLAAATVWEEFTDSGANDFAETAGQVIDPVNNVFSTAAYGLSSQGVSGLTFTPTDWLNRGTINDMAGRANADLNNDFLSGISPWMYDSQDPLTFAAVPEPATLAMWASVLAIGAVIGLRRRQK